MVAVASPQLSYTSFPRTGPHRTRSYESTQSSPQSSPWYACGAKTNVTPETHHPNTPSPMTSVHHKPGDGSWSHLQKRESAWQQRQSPPHPIPQQPNQPNYPKTIQFTQSQDPGHVPFDEANFNLSLNEISLEDTFGFDSNSKSDNVFERLYTGNDEEDGTLQSSIDLNPYCARDFGAQLNCAKDFDFRSQLNDVTKQKKQINQKLSESDTNQNAHSMTKSKLMQRGRNSIFRTHSSQPPRNQPASETTSYEKKINENNQLLSPETAMDRRRAKAQARAQHSIMSPNSSFFTSASPVQASPAAAPLKRTNTGASILRNNTGTSIQRNNTGTSIHRKNTGTSSRSRNRSTSRSHRSQSRGTSRSRRSRSRSTSIAPPKGEDDYHHNLFRGAKMIREQLLRSMASADQAMDEAEREFMEEMIERGGVQGVKQQHQLQAARQKRQDKGDSFDFDKGDIDFDYSFDRGKASDNKSDIASSSSRANGIKSSVSKDSSALETESKRLDNLMGLLGANSSTSSSNVRHDKKRPMSGKENSVQECLKVECNGMEFKAPHVISPSSSLGLSSPSSQLVSPTQNTKMNNEYASHHFQDSTPRLVTRIPSVSSAPKSSMAPTEQAHKEHSHHKYQVHRELPPKYKVEEVDEAIAHAQRAGPLWRSLVGNHVRFPSRWDSILPATSPPIHGLNQKWSKWFYVARHRVKGDKRLNSREFGVRSRRTGGRVLMRLVVREIHSQQVCREIAIGCFHPNSKGVRKGAPLPGAEDVREVWMAVRWLMDVDDDEPTLDLRREGDDYEGVIDKFLMQKKGMLDYSSMGSALGHRKAVHNENVRAMFGDQPPMTTVDLHEDEVADILKANGRNKLSALPALMLLKLFLFSK